MILLAQRVSINDLFIDTCPSCKRQRRRLREVENRSATELISARRISKQNFPCFSFFFVVFLPSSLLLARFTITLKNDFNIICISLRFSSVSLEYLHNDYTHRFTRSFFRLKKRPGEKCTAQKFSTNDAFVSFVLSRFRLYCPFEFCTRHCLSRVQNIVDGTRTPFTKMRLSKTLISVTNLIVLEL